MQSEAIGLLQTGELQAPFLSKNCTDTMRCVGKAQRTMSHMSPGLSVASVKHVVRVRSPLLPAAMCLGRESRGPRALSGCSRNSPHPHRRPARNRHPKLSVSAMNGRSRPRDRRSGRGTRPRGRRRTRNATQEATRAGRRAK